MHKERCITAPVRLPTDTRDSAPFDCEQIGPQISIWAAEPAKELMSVVDGFPATESWDRILGQTCATEHEGRASDSLIKKGSGHAVTRNVMPYSAARSVRVYSRPLHCKLDSVRLGSMAVLDPTSYLPGLRRWEIRTSPKVEADPKDIVKAL